MLSLHTAASGMLAQWNAMDVISNNLANVNTSGFKKDDVLLKSFPEKLMSRINDSRQKFPLGSYDNSPIVGKIGSGVEVNDIFTRFEKKDGDNNYPIRKTGNKMDFALTQEGFFTIQTPEGLRYTRAGVFIRDAEGFLVDMNGNYVMGEKGRIKIGDGDLKVDEMSNILIKSPLEVDYKMRDKLKIVDFYDKQGLFKTGGNYYQETPDSGDIISSNAKILQGFLEESNVNPVREMTNMIQVQRLYEACQKSVQTADQILNKESNDLAQLP